jgi:pimeloyl-ACP methyl ester carboxylesterase
MGASRNMWGAVVGRVAKRTSAVVYDRSGLGRSPLDPATRDLRRLADDLVDLLDHLGAGPFVLVGHSWGGPVVRVAAADRPDRIAGLVLVDATDENCDLFFEPGNERQSRVMARFGPSLARVGAFRPVTKRLARALPEPWAGGLRAEDGTVDAVRAQVAELASSIDDLRGLLAAPPAVPDVPVTVVSGAVTPWYERGRRPALIAAHRARADGLARGRHVLAAGSSHYVPFTEPDLVADEILRIVDAVDEGSTT